MRTLIHTAFMSLDGVIDSPGGGATETHRSGGRTFKDLAFVEDACEIKGRELDDVVALKQTDGGPLLVHGSATPARNPSDARMIDRHHLLLFPLLLGAGKRLFSDTDKAKQMLTLVESEPYTNGIQKLVYDVVH